MVYLTRCFVRPHGRCHVKLLPCQRTGCVCNHNAPVGSGTLIQVIYVGRMRVLAVTCHLHFWQNDRGLLRATAVTRGETHTEITVSTRIWRRKLSLHSCPESNPRTSDHKSAALPLSYSRCPHLANDKLPFHCVPLNAKPSSTDSVQ